MTDIAFIGLGEMGSRIARRLLDAGHPLVGYNRTRSKASALVDRGMRLADTPREAAANADVVFSMVTDTDALLAITGGDDGVLAGIGQGAVYIDMSTVGVAVSVGLAEQVAARGAKMLDCPISGAPVTVEAGEAALMVGGERPVLDRVLPILEAIGAKVTYMGGHGQAVLMKTAVNLNLAVQFAAFSEALLIAEKAGIARPAALEALLSSVVTSPSLAYRAPFIDKLPDPAWFDCTMMQKDLLLALEAGRSLGVPTPTTSTANELLTTARAMGYEDQDFSVIYRVLARMAGVDR